MEERRKKMLRDMDIAQDKIREEKIQKKGHHRPQSKMGHSL